MRIVFRFWPNICPVCAGKADFNLRIGEGLISIPLPESDTGSLPGYREGAARVPGDVAIAKCGLAVVFLENRLDTAKCSHGGLGVG